MTKIVSYKSIGKHQAYDLEVDHPDHQFYLANGLLTSNSHALSYAMDSYQCAWLLKHYEACWLCAYMESQAGTPDDRAAALRELLAFGYSVVPVDINHATDQWTILDGKRFMPSFLTIKGVGAAAVSEIIDNRPYRAIDDLLWDPSTRQWRHSKFNKRALENLIKLRAFESMQLVGEGKPFSSYRHMHACLIEDNALLKRKNGPEELQRRMANRVPEWSNKELLEFSKELIGSFDMSLVVSDALLARLGSANVLSIDELPNDEKPRVCWFIIDSVTPKTTKNNRMYYLLSCMGMSGRAYKIYCWGVDPARHLFEAGSVCLSVLQRTAFGFSTQAFNVKTLSKDKR